jgi:hypothetical protein
MQWNVLMKKELITNSYTVQLTLQTKQLSELCLRIYDVPRSEHTPYRLEKNIQLML